ncbi:MAG: AIR synthase-related protein [Pseudonocardia sp.]
MTVRGFVTAEGGTVEHGQFGGFPPAGDLEAERQLADVLVGAAAERLLDGAQDVSDGGLAQALVEASLTGGRGATITLPPLDPFVTLFSESAGRVLVTTAADRAEELRSRAASAGVPARELGTTGGAALAVDGIPELPLTALRAAWEATLPALFG